MGDPGLHGLRLEAKVQLLGQVVGEVGDHVLCREPPAQLGQFDGLREALEDLQVGGNAAADARPLDLDHHLLAAARGRVVHLGDGRRRERLFLEGGEQPGRLVAEFLDEELVHLVGFAGGTRSSRPRNSRDSDSPNAPGLDAMIWPNFTYVGPRSAKVCGSSLITFCCQGPFRGACR